MRLIPGFLRRKTKSPFDEFESVVPADIDPEGSGAFALPPIRMFDARPARLRRNAVGFSGSANRLLRNAESQLGNARVSRSGFTPSQPVADLQRLAGRTELMRRVIRSIEDQDLHVVLYGDRGIGKTSLLKVINDLATRAQYLVHYVSCGQSASFCEVFRSLASRIPVLYDGTADPTEGGVARSGSLADRLPADDYSVSQLTDVLSSIEGVRVLLILDEFDRSDIEAFRRPVGELIKNLSDRSIRLQLLIGGVAENLTDLVSYIPSIRRNIVGIGVPNLTADEVDEMVNIAEAQGTIRFDAAARERIATVSAGLPYLVGLLGQHATLLASDAGDDIIAVTHVDRALAIACDDISSRLTLRCSHALAQHERSAYADLIRRAAAEATLSGGVIVDSALVAELRRQGDRLSDLVGPVEDDPRGGWRFHEDGAASLVWLKSFLPA